MAKKKYPTDAGNLDPTLREVYAAAAHHPAGTTFDIEPDNLIVGNRRRQHYRNIEPLAESIAANGLRNRITVLPIPDRPGKYILVSGGRRLKAFEHLGWKTYPAIVDDVKNVLVAEAEENNQREPFTYLEMLDIAEAVIEAAGERRGAPKKNAEPNDEIIVYDHTQLWPGARKGEKTREYAARVSGLGSYLMLDRTRAIRDNGSDNVKTALADNAISVNLAYEISLHPKKAQERFLREAVNDHTGEVDKAKLRYILDATREKKKRAGIGVDDENVNIPGKFPALEEQYNLIRIAPDFRKNKVNVLSKLPIHGHGADDTLVCIECPNRLTDKAHELVRTWGLLHKATIVIYNSKNTNACLDYITDESVHIIVCGYDNEENTTFKNARTPSTVECKNPRTDAIDLIEKVFGKHALGRMLDMTSTEPRTGWTNWRDVYGAR